MERPQQPAAWNIHSVLVLKPDSLEIEVPIGEQVYPLYRIASGLLLSLDVQITQEVAHRFSHAEVLEMYSNFWRHPQRNTDRWGETWADQVLDHMTSGPSYAYFVHHPTAGTAENRAKAVRKCLREFYGVTNQVVKNRAHVPDEDEFGVVRRIILASS